MVPAIALLTIGYILIRSGWFHQNIVDVTLGREGTPPQPLSMNNPTEQAIAHGTQAGPPAPGSPGTQGKGVKSYDGVPVAAWIVPWLNLAKRNGWKGKVTSGYRDPSRVITPSPGLPVAPQGKSNHNFTAFPRGAVDVSDPDGFERAIRRSPVPCPLRRDPSIHDPIHFSVTGR